MGVLKAIPSQIQILAARGEVKVCRRLGRPAEPWIQEMADWPLEKAWDYEPPAHPIIDDGPTGTED
jgi:hypothetical protein